MSPLLSLKNEMTKNKLDAILISSVSNIIYLTNFVGFSKDEREAFLFITENKQYILTDGRYNNAVKNKIKNFKLIKISSQNPFIKSLKNLKTKHNIKKLGIEEDNLTIDEYKNLRKHYDNTYHYSGIKLLRNVKNENEISAIEKACRLGDKAFKYILNRIKRGITEKQLAFEIEFFIKRHGADISFPPIVAFGKNSAIPHHRPTNNKLTNNQIILLDFGAKLNNYCSDMTRTVFFGRVSREQKKMYQTVLEAQKRAMGALTSDGGRLERSGSHDSSEVESRGIKASDVDKTARDYILSHGYPTIPHSLGHGVGLEVHEAPCLSPKSKDILKPGMVFTIEPGIYISNFGGVRIEDLFVLGKSELKLLTHSPKDIIEL